MFRETALDVKREVEATLIPSGVKVTLQAGSQVFVTQALGTSYTVHVNGNLVRVGNSVSLRSKKLLDLPNQLDLPWEPFHGYYNEDGFICAKNRHIYEASGLKIAPIDIAKFFSHEIPIPEIENIEKPFAFHKHYGRNNQYPVF